MNRTDGSEPVALDLEPPAASASRAGEFAFFRLRDHTFVDYATQGYLVLVGLLILFFYRGQAGLAHALFAAHVLCLLAIQALIRANAWRPGNRVLDFLRTSIPSCSMPGCTVRPAN